VGVISAYLLPACGCTFITATPRLLCDTDRYRHWLHCSRIHKPTFRSKSNSRSLHNPRPTPCPLPILRCCLIHFDIANSENYADTVVAGREATIQHTYSTTDCRRYQRLPLSHPAAACIAHIKPRLTQKSVIHALSPSSDLVRRGGVCVRVCVWEGERESVPSLASPGLA